MEQAGEKRPHALNMSEVYVEAITQLAQPSPSVKLAAWPLFNQMTGGFRAREFTILCGSTGTGKTTFLANISAQLLKQGEKHFVMSVETGHADFMIRVMSALAARDFNSEEQVDPQVLTQFHLGNAKLLEANTIEFSLYDNRCKVETLMDDVRYMVQKRGCKIAMIDNINFFMEVTSAANQVIEMDRVIHELIIFCKQVDVHLIMVMHPKKTDNGRVESEFDIKGSSTAVQEAHNVFLFNRVRESLIQSGNFGKFDRELTLKKMRRRGKYVGNSLVFGNNNTQYHERCFV